MASASPVARVEIDTKRFNRVLSKYLVVSGKGFVDEVNKRAFNICLKSIRYTKSATEARIIRDLTKGAKTQPAPRKRRKKGAGKGRRKKAPVGAILINYARGKRGEPGLYGQEMEVQLIKNVRSRLKGRGFMKAGWLGAADDIRPHLAVPRPKPKGQSSFSRKGKGTAAKYGAIKPVATIVNGVPWAGRVPAAVKGLKKATRQETRDMLIYLKRKLRRDWDKTKAKP